MFFEVEVEVLKEPAVKSIETEALIRSINSTLEKHVNQKIAPELLKPVASTDDAWRLIDTLVTHLGVALEALTLPAYPARLRAQGRTCGRTSARAHAQIPAE